MLIVHRQKQRKIEKKSKEIAFILALVSRGNVAAVEIAKYAGQPSLSITNNFTQKEPRGWVGDAYEVPNNPIPCCYADMAVA